MKRAFAAWKWSLGVVARSYRTVVLLAAIIALWAFGAYEWLGLPESSGFLLILAFVWAIAQLFVAVALVGTIISGVASAAATNTGYIPPRSLWMMDRKTLGNTLIFFFVGLVLIWLGTAIFGWINAHSVEVASFLTFHSEKPFNHRLLQKIYLVIEVLLWIVLSGFLLSFLVALLRGGWHEAGVQIPRLLAGGPFRTPFLATLSSMAILGGAAYMLAQWRPLVAAGFLDYTQLIVRISIGLVLLSAGVLFWTLSVARLQEPKQESPQL